MDLIKTLEQLMNQDPIVRTGAEKLISQLAEVDFKDYLEKLTAVLIGEGFSISVRKLSATLIKNPIINVPLYTEKWSNFSSETRDSLKQQILSALGSEKPEVRKVAASVIASIAKIEIPISEKWPTLLTILCQNTFENTSFYNAAIETLGFICEELTKKTVLPGEVDQILSAIILCMKDNQSDLQLVISSMKALIRALPLIGNQKMLIPQYSEIIMSQIFNAGDSYKMNEIMLEYVSRAFLEFAENYYDAVGIYLDRISPFTFLLISSNNQKLRLMGFEFWCRLGTEELDRVKNKLNLKNYASKGYLQSSFEKLFAVIDSNILPTSSEDLDDEWTESKACIYILVILVQVIDTKLFSIISNTIVGKPIIINFLR